MSLIAPLSLLLALAADCRPGDEAAPMGDLDGDGVAEVWTTWRALGTVEALLRGLASMTARHAVDGSLPGRWFLLVTQERRPTSPVHSALQRHACETA
jgi:hypothetical protein